MFVNLALPISFTKMAVNSYVIEQFLFIDIEYENILF